MKTKLEPHPFKKLAKRWCLKLDRFGEYYLKCRYGLICLINESFFGVVLDEGHFKIHRKLIQMGGEVRPGRASECRPVIFPLDRLDDVAEVVKARKRRVMSPKGLAHLAKIRKLSPKGNPTPAK